MRRKPDAAPPAAPTREPQPPAKRIDPRPPRVGFVSLGCPKALVDSELILTQLRAEGYAIAPSYAGADLVVVNTCGFIDAAVAESLDAIGEALAENGKVIVTGCLGAKDGGGFVRDAHPKVLAVTGPHAAGEVMSAVHAHLPKPHDPFADLVPPQGIRLTPRHYAYLKISEGCNHRCTFCIIPVDARRSRQPAARRRAGGSATAARRRREGAARDLAGHQRLWRGRPLSHRLLAGPAAEDAHDGARCRARRDGAGEGRVGAAALRLPVSARRRGDRADDRRPCQGRPPALSRRPVPAREPAHPEADEAAGERGGHAAANRGVARRQAGPRAYAARSSPASPARPSASSRSCSRFSRRRSSIASAASPIRPSTAQRRTRCPTPFRPPSRKSGARGSWRSRPGSARGGSRFASAPR